MRPRGGRGVDGLSCGAVNAALKACGEGGLEALSPKVRGRKAGTKRLLLPEQEAEVRKLGCDKRPEQMKRPFALRTREAVTPGHMKLIESSPNRAIAYFGDPKVSHAAIRLLKIQIA